MDWTHVLTFILVLSATGIFLGMFLADRAQQRKLLSTV